MMYNDEDVASNETLAKSKHRYSLFLSFLVFFKDLRCSLKAVWSEAAILKDTSPCIHSVKKNDRVPYGVLMDKLEDCRLNSKIIRWIKNWLKNHTQGVASSDWREFSSGVPEDPNLGPVFFIFL